VKNIFAIYKYLNKYIYISVRNGFGVPNSQEILDKIFSYLIVKENISDINIYENFSDYINPELILKFKNWCNEQEKQEKQEKETNEKETNEKETHEKDLIKSNISWANIVSKKK